MNWLISLLWPTCLTHHEVAEIISPRSFSSTWVCPAEGCDDATVWFQAKPGPDAAPGGGTVTLYYVNVTDERGSTLYDMRQNACRTAWIREVAPVEHDCNADPGPCKFDKEVDRGACATAYDIPEGADGVTMYGAAFPCNRRTDCRMPIASGHNLHGSAIWTAPKGWVVRVGADFWIDREAHVLGTAVQGAWVESTELFSHYSW